MEISKILSDMESVLKKYFGHSQFRPYQKEIIQQILDGRDGLVVMATGSGKSLCYQIPPLVRGKTGVVISPLISLMQDQVMSLKQRGIRAKYLGSSQTDQAAHYNAESGKLHLLYMTPEKSLSLNESFWKKLLASGISLLAVDEAHCISEWGHDFRKEYKRIHTLRSVLPCVPFVGLTATATEKCVSFSVGQFIVLPLMCSHCPFIFILGLVKDFIMPLCLLNILLFEKKKGKKFVMLNILRIK
ncbi:uncharacterized protein LOC144702420 [Wolffia australiana]